MNTTFPTNDTLLTLVRLGPLVTSSIAATFSYAFGVFFGGFRAEDMPASAKWAAMPAWFRRVRAKGLRVIFASYNTSIILGLTNAYFSWPAKTTSTTSLGYNPSWAYLAGTFFSVGYYAFTFGNKLIPMNLRLADEKEPIAKREIVAKELARYDAVRVVVTSGPALVSFLIAALLENRSR